MPLKTLLRPAADTDEDEQSSKAPIERILELVALEDVGPVSGGVFNFNSFSSFGEGG